MNSTGHLVVSMVKSLVRVAACAWAGLASSVVVLAMGFLLAELLGIVEELVDNRD